MNNTKAHQQLVSELLLRIGSLPQFRLWKQVNGLFLTSDGQHPVKIGVNGAADISGIAMGGKRIEIEVKTGLGKLGKDQINYKEMITKFGGIYIEARDTEEACAELHRALGF